MRRLILELLNAVEEGPGELRRDSLESQTAALFAEAKRMSPDGDTINVVEYKGRAVDAVADAYRREGWHVRRCLAPSGSFGGWSDYPHLQFSSEPFSPLSQAWNFFTRALWYAVTLPVAVFMFATAVGFFGGLLLCLGLMAVAGLTIVGGGAMFYALAFVGISAGIIPFILAAVVSTCGVVIYAYRSW